MDLKNELSGEIPRDELPESEFQPISHFAILCFFSLGIYPFFWFYKQWRYLKDEKGIDISPGFRTLFIIFTGYSLFSNFQALAKEKGYTRKIPLSLLFLLYTLFVALTASQNSSLILSFSGLFSFVLLIPALNAINFYYLKEHENYSVKKRMGKDEKIFLILIWAFLLIVFLSAVINVLI